MIYPSDTANEICSYTDSIALGSVVVAQDTHQFSVSKVVICAPLPHVLHLTKGVAAMTSMFRRSYVFFLATTNPLNCSWATNAGVVNNARQALVGQWSFQVSTYKSPALKSFCFFKIQEINPSRNSLVPLHFVSRSSIRYPSIGQKANTSTSVQKMRKMKKKRFEKIFVVASTKRGRELGPNLQTMMTRLGSKCMQRSDLLHRQCSGTKMGLKSIVESLCRGLGGSGAGGGHSNGNPSNEMICHNHQHSSNVQRLCHGATLYHLSVVKGT